jgi:hypothetical protein
MNLEFGGQRAHRRERLPAREFTADEGLPRGEYKLVEDGLSGPQGETG